jgi:hypothetical protein
MFQFTPVFSQQSLFSLVVAVGVWSRVQTVQPAQCVAIIHRRVLCDIQIGGIGRPRKKKVAKAKEGGDDVDEDCPLFDPEASKALAQYTAASGLSKSSVAKSISKSKDARKMIHVGISDEEELYDSDSPSEGAKNDAEVSDKESGGLEVKNGSSQGSSTRLWRQHPGTIKQSHA